MKSTRRYKGPIRALTGLALVIALGAVASTAAAQTPPPEGPPPGFSPTPGAGPAIGQPPPPPPGMPPGYGYGVPGQGYGQVPAGPKELDYEEGDPVPAGYHLKSKKSKGLIIGGAATFGALWLISVVVAPIAQAARNFGNVLSCTSGGGSISTQTGVSGTNNCTTSTDDYNALYIPVAGPLITIGTAHAKGAGIVVLAIDGVAQAGGLAMLIAGLASNSQKLVRNDVDVLAPAPRLMPIVGLGSAGIAGTF